MDQILTQYFDLSIWKDNFGDLLAGFGQTVELSTDRWCPCPSSGD